MIFGTGIDVVEISRFKKFVDRGADALFRRLFSEREIEYCSTKRFPAQHFALRFAAKEAFLKGMGTGLRDGMSWQDMEVVHDDYGKPELILQGRAAEIYQRYGLSRCHLSLSHDGNAAVASVILEKS